MVGPAFRKEPSHRTPTQQYPTKLNVGCGQDKREGYLNIDVDPICAPDLLIVNGDYSAIPRRYFSEVLAKDVLEHFPRAQTLAALLDFADYLVDGGKLIVQTSSILHVAAKLHESNFYPHHHAWTICLFGNQVHSGDFHYSGFTEVTLRNHLIAAGFEIETMELREGWMFHLEARKVSDWTSVFESSQSRSNLEFLQSAFQAAFYRDADEAGIVQYSRVLREGAPRKQVLKQLFSAPERLFRTADRHPDQIAQTSSATAALWGQNNDDFFGGWEASDIDLFQRYAHPSNPSPGKITSFLGIKTTTEFVPWSGLLSGTVIQGIPIPNDQVSADAIEYCALLDSLEAAPSGSFTMVELGASYGPWICAAGVLAKRTRRSGITLVAVEASPFMSDLIPRHLAENEITSDIADVRIFNGAISAQQGALYFPKVSSARENGGQAVDNPPDDFDYVGRRVEYEPVRAYALSDVLPDATVDLLHVDIQGSEVAVIRANSSLLNDCVRAVFVAAHGRKIEGELLELFHSNGWILLRERPARFSYRKDLSTIVGWTTRDGGQYWRNPRLSTN